MKDRFKRFSKEDNKIYDTYFDKYKTYTTKELEEMEKEVMLHPSKYGENELYFLHSLFRSEVDSREAKLREQGLL